MSGEFLERWSRLKRAADTVEPGPQVTPGPRAESAPEDGIGAPQGQASAMPLPLDEAAGAPKLPNENAAELPSLEDLPSLDGLTAASDVSAFLRAGVPAALRNAALRRMWSLDPSIRDFVSEAREYAYDWNSPGSVPGLGPLLPSDDVKAMVRRIFEGAPSEPPVQEDGLVEAATVATEEWPMPDAQGGGDAAASLQVVSEEADSSADASLHSARDDVGKRGPPGLSSEVAPEAEPPLGRRLRRHGGAMPC